MSSVWRHNRRRRAARHRRKTKTGMSPDVSVPFGRSDKQPIAGAEEKILSEERFENLRARVWLQPEKPLRTRRRQPEIRSVQILLAGLVHLFFERRRTKRRAHRLYLISGRKA